MKNDQIPEDEYDRIKAQVENDIKDELGKEFEEKLSTALATLTASNRLESNASMDAVQLAEAMAEAMQKVQKVDLYSRSKGKFQPVPEDELLTPQNFNILDEASKIAHAKGHVLGPWRRRQHDSPSPFVRELPEDWMAVCRSCQATAIAKWMPPSVLEKQEGRWTPSFSGDALTKYEGGTRSLDEQFSRQYPGFRQSGQSGGGGFTTSPVTRPAPATEG